MTTKERKSNSLLTQQATPTWAMFPVNSGLLNQGQWKWQIIFEVVQNKWTSNFSWHELTW